MQLFSADATIFLKKKISSPLKHKNMPLKVAHNPTVDQQLLVQQVFALCN